jgi:phosphoglycerate dehydrogenase-like enzyme
MTGHAFKERAAFYKQFTPTEFELIWMERPDAPAVVAETLKDVEFSYGGALPADWLDVAPRLKLIQLAGVGYRESAVHAARDHGVPVAITPEGTCLGVAEGTILYDLFRKTPEQEGELGVEYLELDELLRVSDIVSLHVYLSERSRGMIGERELGLMKPNAILINTARGAVVDEEALYRALRDRKIWGAGLDAWTQEPTSPDNPILQLDNVVCTPHMATATVDADRMKFQAAIANFQRVLDGESPVNVVEKLYSEVEETLNE